MINPDVVFVVLAGIVLLGFALDAMFDRIRITSVLPLMLVGIALVQFGVVTPSALAALDAFIPYISALTIAFILFSVGLEIRAGELYRVLGRATAFTFVVQTTTGIAISLIAYATFHWDILLCFVFGFGLSGPSSVAVPVLVRLVKVGPALKTTLLYESVVSDLLQLLVPLLLLGFYRTGTVSAPGVVGTLVWQVLGSALAGIAAGIVWLWILQYFRDASRGYTWTLTITLILATYGLSDLAGLSAPITIFVFGMVLGNSLLLDRDHPQPNILTESRADHYLHRVRTTLHLDTLTLDITHIEEVQREVAFFASTFFFVYLGILFEASQLTLVMIIAMVAATIVMLIFRYAFLPLVHPYLDPDPAVAAAERGIVGFNISRGLAAAVIATIPLSEGIVIPGFLDAMFLGILFSNVASTIGIFLLYRPRRSATVPPAAVVEAGGPTAADTDAEHPASAAGVTPPGTSRASSGPCSPGTRWRASRRAPGSAAARRE